MNPFKRMANIWRLSEFEPRAVGTIPAPQGTQTIQLIKKPSQSGRFIPRTPPDPIKELVNETPK